MIGYYLHHQGHGHRRRGVAVARQLRHEVTGLGTGGIPDGWPGRWVELAPDDDPPVHDTALSDVTAGGVLHWVPRHHPGLLQRHRTVLDWLARSAPALVVVDVSVEITLLLRLCGVPVVVGAMPGERTDPVHSLAYDVAEAILAPWPEDAHVEAGWPARWLDKTWHVGGISALGGDPPEAAAPAEQHGRRTVLLLWGSGGAGPGEAQLAAARAATPDWRWLVRGGDHAPSPDLLAELTVADVVVCHAGQGAVADVALARRPAVVLAQTRPHDEQTATAQALERLGLAVTAPGWPAPEQWPSLLARALARGGDRWSTWGGDGAGAAAQALDDLADRLHRPTSQARSTLDPGGAR